MITEHSQKSAPLVSIIIATFHAEQVLEKCISSILGQSLDNIELIIIDGGSTDATCKIISKYSDHITYSISEADQGIYDAMNKGIDQAQGKWILFLGSDDQIHESNTLSNILKESDSTPDLIAGNIVYDTGNRFHPSFNWKMYLKNTLHHQGVLYNRRVFSDFRYNPEHKISGDYELNLKLFLAGASHTIIPETISTCATMGTSHQINPTGYKEEISIRQRLLHNHKVILNLLNTLTHLRLYIKNILSQRLKCF